MARHCPLCQVTEDNFLLHKESELHKVNFIKYFFRKNEDNLIKDKENVKISLLNSDECVPKVVVPLDVNNEITLSFCIEITEGEAMLVQYHLLEQMLCHAELTDDKQVYQGDRVLKMIAGEKYYVYVWIKSDQVGVFPGALAFLFAHENYYFHIVRVIEVNCQNQVTKDSGPEEPYDPKRRYVLIPKAKKIVKGRPLNKMSGDMRRLIPKLHLPDIFIPEEYHTVIEILERENHGRKVPEKLMNISESLKKILAQDLQWLHYSSIFKLLLRFEKVQMDHDIRRYDMKNVTMDSAKNGMLSLEVPGLQENRPSVLRGDKIYVRLADDYDARIDTEYEGTVHQVDNTKVIIGFGKDLILKHIKGLKYHVRFSYNLLPLKHMVLALDNCHKNGLGNLLFPTQETAAQCILVQNPELKLRYLDSHLDGNPQQQLAVKNIVLGTSLPAPFLLFGPPGTGKTVTVVETIKQIWSLFPDARILVCTPSNSASDLITERLLTHVDKKDLLRFFSASRPWDKVPKLLKEKDCTNYSETMKNYFYPSVEEIISFKIVISTLVNSGRLVLAKFPTNHFTHIFIDESGHCVEPEAVIPISTLLECKDPGSKTLGGQLVLSGDPKQLGPTIRSNVAQKRGLGMSILKRLMDKCAVYARSENGYNDNVLAKLVKNYRSHPDILHLPNTLFYERELQACADVLLRESLCDWEHLPKHGFPLIFHGVVGKDQREGKSPSYFNKEEVAVVIDYVQKLLASRKYGIRVQPKEIGVITPYRQQVHKIQAQLRKLNLQEISAGSVDEFQGQERRVIIISTVRSNTQLMALDREYRLGFLQSPERFNVAITRAKALLIIIGNPRVLSKDFYWQCFLEFCVKHGAYQGVRYESPNDAARDLIDRFTNIHLGNNQVDTGDYEIPFSQRAQQEDPSWRGEM